MKRGPLAHDSIADDRAFLDALYDAQAAYMFGMALYQGANRTDAEDAVGEAFVSLSRKVDVLRKLHPSARRAYCVSTVLNALKTIWRRRKARHERPASEVPAPGADTESQSAEAAAMHQLELEALLAALRQLPEGDREVLMARYFRQLSYRDIATQLGVTENTARSRCLRARERLRALLEREEDK